MRVIVGTLAGLGLAVTAAVAQPPGRAAALKAPVAIPADQLPVARGAIDDFPPAGSALPSTPLKRASAPGAAPGPAWISGVDPNLLPAGAAGPSGSVRSLTPPPGRDEAGAPPHLMDRTKPPGGEKQPPHKLAQQGQSQPASPTANTPFRGTGANGAPVYAGPPAYRWYGWGTVTPGANPLAPAGQYPKASANWYSITGATPGAFPVPVTNAPPAAPGTEPPNYGLARTIPAPPTVAPAAQYPVPQRQVRPQPVFQPQPAPVPQSIPQQMPRPEAPRPQAQAQVQAQPESKFLPGTSLGIEMPAPPNVPTLAAPPAPKSVAVALPMPKTNAVATKPIAAPPAAPLPLPPAPKPAPVAARPLPAIPLAPAAPAVEVAKPPSPVASVAKPAPPALPVAEPKPLPTSVTTEPVREQPSWQPAAEPAAPRPGTWVPAQGLEPLPTVQSEGVGSAHVRPVVARGQMADTRPDPVATLVKQLCQGRADGVEVRWTGTKKLQVCFETRTAAEAQKLVGDISKRPELAAYQIDFCVLVK